MKENNFEMVAKTFGGLEEVLAEELRNLGAENVQPGRRMVSFEGDLSTLYKSNLCCRTALRILKPIYKFTATDPDELYAMVKEYDWGSVLSVEKTFSIDPVVNSEEFKHSRFVTYRVKDAIADWFTDRFGPGKRPGVRLQDADVILNVHIDGTRVTISLDSSGESLHKRGWRVAQTEAPINEVLAAGIILLSGWRGDTPFVDPMCGSGTFLVEAAMIAANINPGIFRKKFAFESWTDFDEALLDELYNDDTAERTPASVIIGADMSAAAVEVARRNLRSAGVADYVTVECNALSQWTEAPEAGVLVTNPPYGERISVDDMEGLYKLIGNKLKNIFKGYHAWIIGYKREYFDAIGLAPSVKLPIMNGALECELREYVIFEGDLKSFKSQGGKVHSDHGREIRNDKREGKSSGKSDKRMSDSAWRRKAQRDGFGGGAPKEDRKGKWERRDRRNEKPVRMRDDDFESENPLFKRRNPHALKSIQGKRPSLPPSSGEQIAKTTMRSRGWKKKS